MKKYFEVKVYDWHHYSGLNSDKFKYLLIRASRAEIYNFQKEIIETVYIFYALRLNENKVTITLNNKVDNKMNGLTNGLFASFLFTTAFQHSFSTAINNT